MCPRSTPIPRKILPVIPCDGNSLSFRLPDNSRISRFILRKVIKDTPDCVLLLIAACHDKVKRLVLKNVLKRISEDRTKYTVRLFGIQIENGPRKKRKIKLPRPSTSLSRILIMRIHQLQYLPAVVS